MSTHIASVYDEDLKYLNRRISEMGGLAEQMVAESVRALVNADLALAQTDERLEKVRARAEASLRTARIRVQAASHDVQAAAQDAMHKVDSQVRANPWPAVGIVAVVGFVVGILLGRR